ncbi:MAG: phage holin family protein [Bacteroidales bacterium]
MGTIINILISAIAVYATASLLPGVQIKSFGTAIIVAITLGILNFLIKPILIILTIPITIITLGLFLLVINALVIQLANSLITNFQVTNFWWALLFSLILSAITTLITIIFT